MSKQKINCCKDTIIHQLLNVQAQVTVTPDIDAGKPKVFCVDSKIKPNCHYDKKKKSDKCTFTISQALCVEIPFSIDIDVDVDEGIICCGNPELGPCKQYYREIDCTDQNEDFEISVDLMRALLLSGSIRITPM